MSSQNWPLLITQTLQSLPPLPLTSPLPLSPSTNKTTISAEELARKIDHTLLRVGAEEGEVDDLCGEAGEWGFRTVCVRLPHVRRAVQNLRGTSTGVACVVGFHEGTQSTDEKVAEAREALECGATELDVVLDWRLLLSAFTPPRPPPNDTSQKNDNDSTTTTTTSPPSPSSHWSQEPLEKLASQLLAIRALSPLSPPSLLATSQTSPATLKLILETSQLSPHFVVAAILLSHHSGFDFVKTSTGFCGRGASVEDIVLMKLICEVLAQRTGAGGEAEAEAVGKAEVSTSQAGTKQDEAENGAESEAHESRDEILQPSQKSPKQMQIKASGGIRTLSDALKMLEAGADRLGVSAGVGIMREFARASLGVEGDGGEGKGNGGGKGGLGNGEGGSGGGGVGGGGY